MSWLSDLFRDTLRPTERELLEAEAAWWKDSAQYWRDALKRAEKNTPEHTGIAVDLWQETVEENEALSARLISLSAVLRDICNQGIDSKSGTARAMARKAFEALKS